MERRNSVWDDLFLMRMESQGRFLSLCLTYITSIPLPRYLVLCLPYRNRNGDKRMLAPSLIRKPNGTRSKSISNLSKAAV
jgi:hypothetical protein